MEAATTRGRRKPAPLPADAAAATPEFASQMRELLESVRQRYLDALPIAAAILTLADEPSVECANEQFRFLTEWDERLGERRLAQVPLLASGPIGSRLTAFIAGSDPAFQFETADGRSIGGRHFTVPFAPLPLPPRHPVR